MRKFGNSHRRSNAVWSAGAGRNGSAFLSLMVFFILTKLNLDEGKEKKNFGNSPLKRLSLESLETHF
jgi:hypothetical protein